MLSTLDDSTLVNRLRSVREKRKLFQDEEADILAELHSRMDKANTFYLQSNRFRATRTVKTREGYDKTLLEAAINPEVLTDCKKRTTYREITVEAV